MTETRTEQSFEGAAVAGGLVIGPLHRLAGGAPETRAVGAPEAERSALRAAIEAAGAQIAALIAGEDALAGGILEFQLALLEDDELIAPIEREVAGGAPAAAAWRGALDAEIAEYRAGGDAVLGARADDLADLRDRVLRALAGDAAGAQAAPDGAIVLAEALTPSRFLELDWSRLGGAATVGGSPTGHVALLAKARGVPLVVGVDAAALALSGDPIAILDAEAGRLTVAPAADILAAAEVRRAADHEARKAIEAARLRPARTAAGEPVTVLANIDDLGLLDDLSPEICDGVGLTRTEFLFRGGARPDEETQLEVYRRLLDWAEGRPVTIRTLDAGGDKPIPGLTIDGEANPFLGVRGLRLSLARPDVFRTQLRALARAALYGRLKVMLPMVTAPWELETVRGMIDEEVAALRARGVDCARPPLGMMVEAPAAALTAEAFHADFYSIGSNDLIQYATACARDNAAVSKLADPQNPAVLELIRRTVEAARARGVEVSLCGDMASSPALVAPLLGCGLRVLSVAPAQIGPVKAAIAKIGAADG